MKIITEYTPATQVDVIKIKSAVYAGDFVVRINFNDGSCQNVDFRPFLNNAMHPSIRQYLDETKFKQFAIIDGNLNWHNYELIFPLDTLYNGHVACC